MMWFAVVLVWLIGDTSGDPDKLFFASPFRSQVECVEHLGSVRSAFDDYLKEQGVDKRELKIEVSCEEQGPK